MQLYSKKFYIYIFFSFLDFPENYQQPKSGLINSIKSKISKLHEEFVIAPADKAYNNVIFIWKIYYLEVLRKELTTTSAYIKSTSNKTQILAEHSKILKDFNIPLTKPALPSIYWLPKLHKRPYKSRFIANSSHCSLNDLSIHISSAILQLNLI